MRKLLLACTAVTALALPSAAAASDRPDLPDGTCDVIKNTICHLIPPTSVEDVCAIVDATTQFDCSMISVQQPEIPSSCEYLANTYCHYLPPTSVEQACAFAEAVSRGAISCTISRS
jgi:hypothetical protein